MGERHMPTRLQASVPIATLLVLVLAGCGGGPGGTGGAAGWVYQPIGGGTPIVSADDTPPPGYEPVSGATVRIGGFPDLTTTTNEDGYYLIEGIPPGEQTLVVEVPAQPPLEISIPIIAGHVTMGSGHEEGGGGIS